MDANGLEHLWGAAASGDDAAIEGVKMWVSVTLRGASSRTGRMIGLARCCFFFGEQMTEKKMMIILNIQWVIS